MKRRTAIKNTIVGAGTVGLAATLSTILQSCKQEPTNSLSWEPKFLNKDQAELISALVDTVLPRTETPGGIDVGVDVFLDAVFDQLYTEEGKADLIREMEAFDQKCIESDGKRFAELNAEEKESILMLAELNSPLINDGVWGVTVGQQEPVGFYRSLKSTMIWAYCSSEVIGSKYLQYDPIPGDYQPCLPLSDVGGVWSL